MEYFKERQAVQESLLTIDNVCGACRFNDGGIVLSDVQYDQFINELKNKGYKITK